MKRLIFLSATMFAMGCGPTDSHVRHLEKMAYMDGVLSVINCDLQHMDSPSSSKDCIQDKLDQYLKENE